MVSFLLLFLLFFNYAIIVKASAFECVSSCASALVDKRSRSLLLYITRWEKSVVWIANRWYWQNTKDWITSDGITFWPARCSANRVLRTVRCPWSRRCSGCTSVGPSVRSGPVFPSSLTLALRLVDPVCLRTQAERRLATRLLLTYLLTPVLPLVYDLDRYCQQRK